MPEKTDTEIKKKHAEFNARIKAVLNEVHAKPGATNLFTRLKAMAIGRK